MNLRLNYELPQSKSNGPGTRYTIWVQGCSIHCPGCMNFDTWDPTKGYKLSVDELVEKIDKTPNIDGITITGGEPLDQCEPVYELCLKLFKKIPIFLTTGYTFSQVRNQNKLKILKVLDILCLGPFDKDQVCRGYWKGSLNQEIIFLTPTGKKQLKKPVIPEEIYVEPSGNIILTGFSPSNIFKKT